MRVGIVSSSQGYTFAELCAGVEHLGVTFSVITDRPCGIEAICHSRGISVQRIVFVGKHEFSRSAAAAFESQSVDFVLLFFNRLISGDLYAALPTFNIHPSLLPAFPGFRALEKSRERKVRFVGATLHLVTEEADQGPIVAQLSTPVWPAIPQETLNGISFVQRVYLSLLAVELKHVGALSVSPADGHVEYVLTRPYDACCNPAVQDEAMLAVVRRLELARNIRVTS